MKKFRYLLVAGLAVAMIAGCDNDETLGENNKGKEKPSVSLTIDKRGDVELVVTLTPSESAAQYAYMLVEGKGNASPSALELVCGDASGAFNNNMATYSSDTDATATVEMSVNADTDYEIFVAAITGEGVLSEVGRYSLTTRDYTYPAPGRFLVNYPDLYNVEDGPLVLNSGSGAPFEAELMFVPEADVFAPLAKAGYEYMLALDLFNLWGSPDDAEQIFLGYNDLENDCIAFDKVLDYDRTNGVFVPSAAFGELLGLYSETLLYVFYGDGEDGMDPFTISYDIDGNLQELSYLEMDLHQYAQGFPWVGAYDAIIGGTLTPMPESPAQP